MCVFITFENDSLRFVLMSENVPNHLALAALSVKNGLCAEATNARIVSIKYFIISIFFYFFSLSLSLLDFHTTNTRNVVLSVGLKLCMVNCFKGLYTVGGRFSNF